jgi:hypothetical protein
MPDSMNYEDFYTRLRELVASGAQGTLFVRTDDNHSIIVAVRGRRIVSLSCGPRRGEAAIPLIRQMRAGTVRLDDGAIPHREQDLPATDAILALLRPGAPEQDPAAPAAGTAPDPQRARALLCELLAGYLGPVAPLICEEKILAMGDAGGPAQWLAALEEIAREIDDRHEAEEFLRQARRQLQLGG